jgi:hypothetical protein
MFHSATIDPLPFPFPCRHNLVWLKEQAKKQTEVFGDDSECQDSDEQGIVIKSPEQLQEFRFHIQELRKRYRSEIKKYPENLYSITKIFVSGRFDEDGWDGEEWHGVEITFEYKYTDSIEYVSIGMKDAVVTKNPNL